MKDRNYWRACDTSRLIEEARDSGNELAIVLAERLEDTDVEAQAELADWKQMAEDLEIDCTRLCEHAVEIDDKVYQLRAEIEKLELMIAERDRIIEELKNV